MNDLSEKITNTIFQGKIFWKNVCLCKECTKFYACGYLLPTFCFVWYRGKNSFSSTFFHSRSTKSNFIVFFFYYYTGSKNLYFECVQLFPNSNQMLRVKGNKQKLLVLLLPEFGLVASLYIKFIIVNSSWKLKIVKEHKVVSAFA